MIELGLIDAIDALGIEINDPTLSIDADGGISRAFAVRALKTGFRDTHSELIARVVRAHALHLEVDLSQDANDKSLYALPPRTVQILYAYDDNGQDFEPLGALVKGSAHGVGFRWMENGLRLFWGSSPATLHVMLAQDPPAPTYGTATAGAATTITLSATPIYGATSLEVNYYVGARIAIEDGTGAGQVRPVTAHDAATRVLTVPTWTTNPDNTSKYSFLAGVPRGSAYRAAILHAVLTLKRTYKAIARDEDDIKKAYGRTLDKAVADLKKRTVGHLPRIRQVESHGFIG